MWRVRPLLCAALPNGAGFGSSRVFGLRMGSQLHMLSGDPYTGEEDDEIDIDDEGDYGNSRNRDRTAKDEDPEEEEDNSGGGFGATFGLGVDIRESSTAPDVLLAMSRYFDKTNSWDLDFRIASAVLNRLSEAEWDSENVVRMLRTKSVEELSSRYEGILEDVEDTNVFRGEEDETEPNSPVELVTEKEQDDCNELDKQLGEDFGVSTARLNSVARRLAEGNHETLVRREKELYEIEPDSDDEDVLGPNVSKSVLRDQGVAAVTGLMADQTLATPPDTSLFPDEEIPPHIAYRCKMEFLDKQGGIMIRGLSSSLRDRTFGDDVEALDLVMMVQALSTIKCESLDSVGIARNLLPKIEELAVVFTPNQKVVLLESLSTLGLFHVPERTRLLKKLKGSIKSLNSTNIMGLLNVLRQNNAMNSLILQEIVQTVSSYSGTYSGPQLASILRTIVETDNHLGPHLTTLLEVVSKEIFLRPEQFSSTNLMAVLMAFCKTNFKAKHVHELLDKKLKQDLSYYFPKGHLMRRHPRRKKNGDRRSDTVTSVGHLINPDSMFFGSTAYHEMEKIDIESATKELDDEDSETEPEPFTEYEAWNDPRYKRISQLFTDGKGGYNVQPFDLAKADKEHEDGTFDKDNWADGWTPPEIDEPQTESDIKGSLIEGDGSSVLSSNASSHQLDLTVEGVQLQASVPRSVIQRPWRVANTIPRRRVSHYDQASFLGSVSVFLNESLPWKDDEFIGRVYQDMLPYYGVNLMNMDISYSSTAVKAYAEYGVPGNHVIFTDAVRITRGIVSELSQDDSDLTLSKELRHAFTGESELGIGEMRKLADETVCMDVLDESRPVPTKGPDSSTGKAYRSDIPHAIMSIGRFAFGISIAGCAAGVAGMAKSLGWLVHLAGSAEWNQETSALLPASITGLDTLLVAADHEDTSTADVFRQIQESGVSSKETTRFAKELGFNDEYAEFSSKLPQHQRASQFRMETLKAFLSRSECFADMQAFPLGDMLPLVRGLVGVSETTRSAHPFLDVFAKDVLVPEIKSRITERQFDTLDSAAGHIETGLISILAGRQEFEYSSLRKKLVEKLLSKSDIATPSNLINTGATLLQSGSVASLEGVEENASTELLVRSLDRLREFSSSDMSNFGRALALAPHKVLPNRRLDRFFDHVVMKSHWLRSKDLPALLMLCESIGKVDKPTRLALSRELEKNDLQSLSLVELVQTLNSLSDLGSFSNAITDKVASTIKRKIEDCDTEVESFRVSRSIFNDSDVFSSRLSEYIENVNESCVDQTKITPVVDIRLEPISKEQEHLVTDLSLSGVEFDVNGDVKPTVNKIPEYGLLNEDQVLEVVKEGHSRISAMDEKTSSELFSNEDEVVDLLPVTEAMIKHQYKEDPDFAAEFNSGERESLEDVQARGELMSKAVEPFVKFQPRQPIESPDTGLSIVYNDPEIVPVTESGYNDTATMAHMLLGAGIAVSQKLISPELGAELGRSAIARLRALLPEERLHEEPHTLEAISMGAACLEACGQIDLGPDSRVYVDACVTQQSSQADEQDLDVHGITYYMPEVKTPAYCGNYNLRVDAAFMESKTAIEIVPPELYIVPESKDDAPRVCGSLQCKAEVLRIEGWNLVFIPAADFYDADDKKALVMSKFEASQ